MFYLYLHGFASSPRSAKAQEFQNRFQRAGQSIVIPDLNQPDFSTLTLSRQLHQAQALLPVDQSAIVIGSSFGGLTAAWLAEHYPQIVKLVLLAPAFHYLDHWLPTLDPQTHDRWKAGLPLPVYHYDRQTEQPLHYDIVEDLKQYDEAQLQRSVPTLIVHGSADSVIPVQSSRDYAQQRPWVSLHEIDDDHALGKMDAAIWHLMETFCGLHTTAP